MGRPRVRPLTDDEARVIQRGMSDLLQEYGNADNRTFLDAFIRLLHKARGRLHGPQWVEQLLAVYGDGRRPSRTTINAVLQAVKGELGTVEPERIPPRQLQPASGEGAKKNATRTATFGESGAVAIRALESMLASQREELAMLRKQLSDAQAVAAREAARAASLATELELSRAKVAELEADKGNLYKALGQAQATQDGYRTFALNAIELARSETRREREIRQGLEAKLAQSREEVQIYRRRLGAGEGR